MVKKGKKKFNVRRGTVVDYRDIVACLDEEECYSEKDHEEEDCFHLDGREIIFCNIFENIVAASNNPFEEFTYVTSEDEKDSKISAAEECEDLRYTTTNRKAITINDFLFAAQKKKQDWKSSKNEEEGLSSDLTAVQTTNETPNKRKLLLPYPIKRNVDEINQKTTIHLPAQLKVMSQSVNRDKMRIRYGAYYSEASSFPRRFAVSYGSGTFGLSFLLVTVLKDDGSAPDGYAEIKIDGYGVNKLDVPSPQRGGIGFDFKDIVSPLLVINDGINKDGKGSSCSQTTTFKNRNVFNFESSLANFTKTNLLTFPDVFGIDGMTTVNAPNVKDDLSIDGDCIVHGQTCSNCSIESDSFTTLLQCGHSFCNECFRAYIEVESTDGKPSITCMEHGCSTEIDAVTALSFMEPSTKSLKKFTWKGKNVILKDNRLIKKCPTNGCQGKAFKATIDSSDEMCGNIRFHKKAENAGELEEYADNNSLQHKHLNNSNNELQVQCTFCKNKWCFECQSPSHWPLPCDVAASYKKHSDITGESRNSDAYFTARDLRHLKKVLGRCPHCKVIIEKNGGCSSMFCIQCKQNFTWDKNVLFRNDVSRWVLDTFKISFYTVRAYSVLQKSEICEAYETWKSTSKTRLEDEEKATTSDITTHKSFYELLLKVNHIEEALHVLTKVSQSRHKRRRLTRDSKTMKKWISEGKTLLIDPNYQELNKKCIGAMTRKILSQMNQIMAYYC